MYERFYGLRERPFNLTPDPEFLFLTRTHKEALEKTIYGISRREGFTVILGDVGTGKTTLCWALLGRLENDVMTALVLNPVLSDEDLLRAILQDFGVRRQKDQTEAEPGKSAPASQDARWMQGLSKKDLLDELNRFLLDCAAEEVFCVVIIDEAQNLAIGALEQLRMLSNLETAKTKLLQIIFVGQLEFGEKLKSERLKSLNQRISNRYRIEPLSRKEVGEYINHRLKVAQAPDELGFSRSALRSVRRFSRGYPRLINLICDRALLAGYSEKSFWISGRMIRKAARGLSGRDQFHVRRPPLAGVFVPVATLILIAVVAALFLWSFRWGGPLKSWFFEEAAPARAMTRDMPGEQAPEKAAPVDVDPRPPAQPVTAEPPRPSVSSVTREPPQPAAPVPRAEPVVPAAPPPAGRASALIYMVQVYSLISGDQAQKVVAQLRADGHEAFIKVEGKWSVILVGPFHDVKLAEESLTGIARAYGTTPILRVSSEATPR